MADESTESIPFGPGIEESAPAQKAPRQSKKRPQRSHKSAPPAQPAPIEARPPAAIIMGVDAMLDLPMGNMIGLHVEQRVTDPQIIELIKERGLAHRAA